MDALRPRLGELGVGLLRELFDPPLELLDVPRDPPAPELDPVSTRLRAPRRRSSRFRPAPRARPCRRPGRARPGARSCAGSPRGCRTSSPSAAMSPAQPWRKMHSAPGQAGLDRLAERAREVRVPEQALAADQRRMAREARDDGDRATVLRVDPQHRHAVVDRPLAPDPVDADPGRAAGSPADARRPPPAPRRVDGSRRAGRAGTPPTGANEPVSASPATVEPRETLGALWLCAAFTSTASGGIPVSFCTRSRTAAVMSAPAKTRSTATIATGLRPSSRTSAWPIIGSWIPSARPVRADQQPCGRPEGGVTSTRATPAVRAHERSFLTVGRPARRTPPAAAS